MPWLRYKPRDCEDCGVPIKGAWSNKKRAWTTRCLSCAHKERARRTSLYPGDKKRQDKNSYLKRVHGITLAEYDEILAQQGGVCAICRGGSNGVGTFHVDHEHATGRHRGLLCYSCNQALGLVRDDVERLRRMIEYLE